MLTNIVNTFGLLLLTLFFISCESDPVSSEEETPEAALRGVFIANEGNFQQGNASLSYFDADQGGMYNNVFKNTNSRDLGDVANSIYLNDSLAYIVINNSDKIEVISTTNFKSKKTIAVPAGASPRNLTISSSGMLYVTSLYLNKVMVLDAEEGNLIKSIDVGENPEGILITQGFAFVTNSGFGVGNTVSVISLSSDQVTHIIKVGDNPQWIELSGTGLIHVLCAGAYNDFLDPNDDTPGGVWVIDPSNHSVIDSMKMEKGSHPSELSLSNNGKGYFIYQQAVLAYNTETLDVADSTLIQLENGIPYHVRVNDISKEIYVCDAGDFINPGNVYRYDLDGNEKSHHNTGVIPGYVCFVNVEKRPD